MKKSASPTLLIVILFATFVVLAMPGAIPSVGWPAMRDEFGLRQDGIGLLLIMGTIGHLISGAFNGRLMYRLGTKHLLLTAVFILGLTFFGYWIAPSWFFLVGMAQRVARAASRWSSFGGQIGAAVPSFLAPSFWC